MTQPESKPPRSNELAEQVCKNCGFAESRHHSNGGCPFQKGKWIQRFEPAEPSTLVAEPPRPQGFAPYCAAKSLREFTGERGNPPQEVTLSHNHSAGTDYCPACTIATQPTGVEATEFVDHAMKCAEMELVIGGATMSKPEELLKQYKRAVSEHVLSYRDNAVAINEMEAELLRRLNAGEPPVGVNSQKAEWAEKVKSSCSHDRLLCPNCGRMFDANHQPRCTALDPYDHTKESQKPCSCNLAPMPMSGPQRDPGEPAKTRCSDDLQIHWNNLLAFFDSRCRHMSYCPWPSIETLRNVQFFSAERQDGWVDALKTHQYKKFYLRSGCTCGWGTTLGSESECWDKYVQHIASVAALPAPSSAPEGKEQS